MRLYDKSVIYWRSPPGSDLPAPVPWHMIPVRPRHRMQSQPGDVETKFTGGGGRKRMEFEVIPGGYTKGGNIDKRDGGAKEASSSTCKEKQTRGSPCVFLRPGKKGSKYIYIF